MELRIVTVLPAIVGVIYAITSVAWIIKGDYRWAAVWGGYAVAQIGLVLTSAGD